MSKHLSKQEIIKNKKKSIIQLNDLLESYISDKEKLRKADLLSKWLKDYVNYLKFEDIFDPKRNISYNFLLQLCIISIILFQISNSCICCF